jgi:hypothetical protein
VPSGYESPRVPLPKKMFFGDSAPIIKREEKVRKYGSLRRRRMQSRDEVPTERGLPEVHRRTLTSRIVLTRAGSLKKRQPGGGVGCTARRNGGHRQEDRA